MDPLAKRVIDAHGGLEPWQAFDTVSASLVQRGALWALKGQPHALERTAVTVGLREEWASHSPFGTDGRRSRFAPDRVALETADGVMLEELLKPRGSFAGHRLDTPWTELQLAYFAGCAMWTYLNMPFLIAWPGVESEEGKPWEEEGTRWRRLHLRFPPNIATHSTNQTLYVDGDGLLRRHDYDVEIAGSTPGAHFISDYVQVAGIAFPTKRRIFPRGEDGRAMPEPLVVSIDLSDIALR
jgi:hypothetical protein